MNMFLPIEDQVVIQTISEAGTTAGGIIIPDTTQEATLQGTVIATGPGRNLENGDRTIMQCKENDVVVYPKYGAKEIEIDGEDYLIIRERELLTILER